MARPRTVIPTRVAKDVTVDIGAIGAGEGLDVEVAIAGIQAGAPVIVWAEALTDDISLSNAHCAETGTLKFRVVNPTGSTVNPDELTIRVVQF